VVKGITKQMGERQTLAEIKERFSGEALPQRTLCFLIKGNQVLLVMKRDKNVFGANRWNGPGGGLKPEDSSIEVAARRETLEETEVTPRNIKKVAILNFYFLDKSEWNQQVVVFTTHDWDGTPAETDEMVTPKWFDINKIPYGQMWESDFFWLPKVLGGKIVEGNFLYNENQEILEHEVIEIA